MKPKDDAIRGFEVPEIDRVIALALLAPVIGV
jgi:hypothetical protein